MTFEPTDRETRIKNAVEDLAMRRGVTVSYKNSSRLMKLLGLLLFFNRRFMTDYVTTIGKVVYYPSMRWYTDNPGKVWRVLCHELVHHEDSRRMGSVAYSLWYLFPVPLALLSLFAFAYLPMLMFLVCLAPLPAAGRMWAEGRGYAVSMAVEYWLRGCSWPWDGPPENIVRQFSGPSYYFMMPFRGTARWLLAGWMRRVEDETILSEIPISREIRGIIDSINRTG